MEVADELAEHLRHLARVRGQPLESLTAELLGRGLDQERRRQQAEDALAGLTPRQREVAQLAVGGRTNRQIARELWLSPETVKTHLRRTLEHFDLHSKAELRLLLLGLDGGPLQGAKRDPLQGAKRDPLQGAKRDPLQGALPESSPGCPSRVPPSGCEARRRRDEARCADATERDPLRDAPYGVPRGCEDAMRGATQRDPLRDAPREARLPGD